MFETAPPGDARGCAFVCGMDFPLCGIVSAIFGCECGRSDSSGVVVGHWTVAGVYVRACSCKGGARIRFSSVFDLQLLTALGPVGCVSSLEHAG